MQNGLRSATSAAGGRLSFRSRRCMTVKLRGSFVPIDLPPEGFHLRTNALPRKAPFFRASRNFCLDALFRSYGAPSELLFQFLEAQLAVAELTAGFAGYDNDAAWPMNHPHSRIGRVDALTARAAGVKRLNVALRSYLFEACAREPRELDPGQTFHPSPFPGLHQAV